MYISKHVCIISCAVLLLAWQCAADVNSVVNNNNNNRRQFITRRNQAQRLTEADQTAYPAVGFRPARPFNLPNGQNIQPQQQQSNNFNENFNQQTEPQRPENLYDAPQQQQQQQQQLQQQIPARLQQQQPLVRQQQQQPQFQQQQGFTYPQYVLPQSLQQQQQQQQYQLGSQQFQLGSQQYQFGPQQFPQAAPARLSAEPDEREVVDNNSDDIEVNVENAAEEVPATRSVAAAPVPPPQATVTYFPANAVNFVKPFQVGPAPGNPGATFIQYQPNLVTPPLAKAVAANPAPLPISAQYYASNAFLPSTVAFNSYTAFPRAAAPLQAW